jgi:predicted transglutaminase-like cysteine proteinase
MRRLMQRGVAPTKLLLALAITAWGERHVVLVVRTPATDLILDNLDDRVIDWRDAHHRIIAMQNPDDLKSWVRVHSIEAPPFSTNVAVSGSRHRL